MWSEVRPPATTQVRDAFGVEVGELRAHPGGFEADAFTDGRWFVKLWRQQPDSDAALALTAELAARGIPVPAAQRALDVPHVVCHHDLFPHNALVDRDGRVATLLDWGHAMRAPREHDVFAALCGPDPARFLRAYGAERLDLTHLEYARLARSLRDLAVRICAEVDLDGVNTWGFDGLRRVDADLMLARPFCDR